MILTRLAFIQSFLASILAYLLRGYCRPCHPVPKLTGGVGWVECESFHFKAEYDGVIDPTGYWLHGYDGKWTYHSLEGQP